MMDANHDQGISKAMDEPSVAYRRLRLALDCILILLVILIASGNRLGVRAEPDRQAPTASMDLVMNPVAPGSSPAEDLPALLDNNPLAAMIAAENAALPPPLYFSSLPLINH